MNSDPTGYFTLFEMSIAMNVQNQLRDTYNSAIIDGFLNFLDTLLGGETDPTALLTSFARGVSAGLVTGALSSGISAMANLSCKLAKASSMLKMGMAGFGFLGSAYSTLQSLEDGNAQQAGFRFILTAISGIGFKRAMGEGMATINSNCFIAGTLVLTENGNKPIEEIEVGDKVLAENPETGEQEYKEVVQVFENETNELVHLTVNSEEIVTTPKHPFYVPQRGWINAIDLKAGDILVLSNGEYVTIEQVQHEILEAPVKIYNFEVEDFHTYYVGENSVLVHNVCGSEFEGTIYRSVNSEYDPLEMSQYTINSNHRYTEKGIPGLYFSSGEKIVRAELGNYDVFDFSNRTMYSYDVKLTNMLDVSNPSIRSQLGISLNDIVGENYDITHAVGRFAYNNGYNGIIAPSARADGGVNIILFNAGGLK